MSDMPSDAALLVPEARSVRFFRAKLSQVEWLSPQASQIPPYPIGGLRVSRQMLHTLFESQSRYQEDCQPPP
jgi:hypothetical protein